MNYNYKLDDYVQSYNYISYIDFVVNELIPILNTLRFSEFVVILDDYEKLVLIYKLINNMNKNIKMDILEKDSNSECLLTISYDYEFCIENRYNGTKIKKIDSDLIIVNKSNIKNTVYLDLLCCMDNERMLIFDIEEE